MRLRKVSSDLFYRIKEMEKITSVQAIADLVGLSRATVGRIKNCEEYEDYLDFLKDHTGNLERRLREMNLPYLTGEPLFWKIHTDCRTISNNKIAAFSNLKLNEIKAMKEAEDYESYLKGKEMPTLHRAVTFNLTKTQFDEVKKYLADGESIRDIADTFEIDYRTVERIARHDSYLSFCAMRRRGKNEEPKKFSTNDGIIEIINDGFKKGLSVKEIRAELPYSVALLLRVKSGKKTFTARTISKEQYEKIKQTPALYPRLGSSIRRSPDYYTWSLKKYALVDSVSWWNTEDASRKKVFNKHEKLPEPAKGSSSIEKPVEESAETPIEPNLVDSEEKSTTEKSVIEKPAVEKIVVAKPAKNNPESFKHAIIIWVMVLISLWVLALILVVLKLTNIF